MKKKFANAALIYAVIALTSGVFYREFTKLNDFTGKTNLSALHTHYFVLGMFFFLILLLMENAFHLSNQPKLASAVVIYHIGLNLSTIMLFVRGVQQVLIETPSHGLDASIAGVSGLGHIVLGVGLILILIKIKKAAIQ